MRVLLEQFSGFLIVAGAVDDIGDGDGLGAPLVPEAFLAPDTIAILEEFFADMLASWPNELLIDEGEHWLLACWK